MRNPAAILSLDSNLALGRHPIVELSNVFFLSYVGNRLYKSHANGNILVRLLVLTHTKFSNNVLYRAASCGLVVTLWFSRIRLQVGQIGTGCALTLTKSDPFQK